MHINERLGDHQKFKELALLAQRGFVSDIEQLELNNHLRVCHACRQVCGEYSLIDAVGMPFLAATIDQNHEAEEWDNEPARAGMLANVQSIDDWDCAPGERVQAGSRPYLFNPQKAGSLWALGALAAGVLFAIAGTMYWMGSHARLGEPKNSSLADSSLRDVATGSDAKQELFAVQQKELSQLQSQLAKAQHEVSTLETALQSAENHSAVVAVANAKTLEQLRQATVERDQIAHQLQEAEQSYQLLQAELTTLRADHERNLLQTTSLQTKVGELEASARDQERRLKDDEQYLSSDRDIRELMGARKLYIADVFDVDSGSRPRKPFGRVFYTQNKSLVFYAFDLDRQPGVKNASAFQVWGQRDAEEQNHATNLGILYMDSESNRRWVLKIDDSRQLAEIDAVFVTIEPRGGSQKPTGKPFLYALLRKEANHP
jgi:hypothetical protein